MMNLHLDLFSQGGGVFVHYTPSLPEIGNQLKPKIILFR